MKTLMILLLLVTIAFAQTTVVDLPSDENKTDCNGEWSALRDSVIKYQKIFFEKNKFYFQGLSDRDSAKFTDTAARFDRKRKPSDQSDDWEKFGLNDVTIRGRLWMDVYQTPGKNWGWQLFYQIGRNDTTWTIQHHEGVEKWREWDGWKVEKRVFGLEGN